MDDYVLVSECVKGSLKVQWVLFDKFVFKMLVVCCWYFFSLEEVEDVLQDGFIKIFQKIGEFKMEGFFEGWICWIMVNIVFDVLRKKKKLQVD